MRRPKGTGSVYKRVDSPVWWIKYSRNGKAYRESSRTTDRHKAEKMLRHRLAEISFGAFIGPQAERVRVDELAEDLLRDYRINSRKSLDDVQARWTLHLRPFFGVLRAVDVTSERLARYVDARQKEGAKHATINRELAALKRMFHIGQQSTPAKVMRLPHFPHLAEINIRQGFLEDHQFRSIVEGEEMWFRALVECGRTYGWRISELLTMHVRQVDLIQRVIRLEPGTTKNSDGREVILTNSMSQLIGACVRGKEGQEYVFTRPDGKPVRDFRTTWENACVRAGVGSVVCARCGEAAISGRKCKRCGSKTSRYSGLIFHDLRRTAARNLRRAGIAETVIMKIGGWRTRSVFERYAIVNRMDIADAMQKLQESERLLADKSRIGHAEIPRDYQTPLEGDDSPM